MLETEILVTCLHKAHQYTKGDTDLTPISIYYSKLVSVKVSSLSLLTIVSLLLNLVIELINFRLLIVFYVLQAPQVDFTGEGSRGKDWEVWVPGYVSGW